MSDNEDKKVHGNTKYQEGFVHQANQLCKLGATDEEMANAFQVCRDTIIEWRKDYPEFADACHAGKMVADAQVADALFNRAIGYQHPDTKMFLDRDEEGHGTVLTEEYMKHYPPDTQACKWWLTNRQRDKWQDKTEVEVTDKTPVNGVTESIQGKLNEVFDKNTSE